MPMTKEEKTIYDRAYNIKNNDKRLQQKKEWRELNKDYNKVYGQTAVGIKSRRISSWKFRGMILRQGEDWDSIYRKYIDCTNCEECNKFFQNSKDRNLDHCHTTGYIRNIVCHRCNIIRGFEDAKSK